MKTQKFLQSIRDEYQRYRITAEKAYSQLSDEELNHQPRAGENSVGVLMRHLGGNLTSRFTDFLKADGEKDWRDREGEFAPGPFPRDKIVADWARGIDTLETTLAAMTDEDLHLNVKIRGIELSVMDALSRSLSHFAYHVGQIVLLSRAIRGDDWKWISIPPGQTAAYNANPDKERRPDGGK